MTQTEYIEQANDLLEELADYFDNMADADWQGDPGAFVPNKEMQIFMQIRDLLDRKPKAVTV